MRVGALFEKSVLAPLQKLLYRRIIMRQGLVNDHKYVPSA